MWLRGGGESGDVWLDDRSIVSSVIVLCSQPSASKQRSEVIALVLTCILYTFSKTVFLNQTSSFLPFQSPLINLLSSRCFQRIFKICSNYCPRKQVWRRIERRRQHPSKKVWHGINYLKLGLESLFLKGREAGVGGGGNTI